MASEKFLLFPLVLLAFSCAASAATCTSIEQFGITWAFDKAYECGQFANGDYWVKGPVTITMINPMSTDISGRVKHGSVVNPLLTGTFASDIVQGYDSTLWGTTYKPALNAGRPNNQDISSANPLTLPAGSSLISTESNDCSACNEQFKRASVLTVLSSVPAPGSFRPPYMGTDKTVRFNKSQLDYSLLVALPITQSIRLLMPRLHEQPGDAQDASVERMFRGVWLDHLPDVTSSQLHPTENMKRYPQYLSTQVGIGALMLNLDYSSETDFSSYGSNNAYKEKLLVRFVQVGIDNYGIIKNGGYNNWPGNGGHNSARKWPILFAGMMLNDNELKSIGATTAFPSKCGAQPCFGEDAQTFYVSQTDIDIGGQIGGFGNCGIIGHHDVECAKNQDFLPVDIGLPEWGIVHTDDPFQDDKTWISTTKSGYRFCCLACSWAGWVLAAHIMNAKSLWNNNALFDYQDRYMQLMLDYTSYRQDDAFTEKMWDTYRANYDCVYTGLINNVRQYGCQSQCAGTDTDCGNGPTCAPCNPGQKCCNNSCISPACTATSGCGSNQLCVNPGTCNAQCQDKCILGTTQQCNTGLQGICSTGTQTCQSNGLWSACNQNPPTTENCSNSLDDDCDGTTDCGDSDCSAATECQSIIPAGSTLELTFDGDYSDHSGNSHQTSCVNGCPSYVAGKVGQAMQFNGVTGGSYINVKRAADLDGMAAITIAFWAKKSTASTGGIAMLKHASYDLEAGNNAFSNYLFNAANTRLDLSSTANSINDTEWHHYAVTYNGTTVKHYIDGKETGSKAFTGNISTQTSVDLTVGGNPWTATFGGVIDEVLIYSRALSAQEIKGIYSYSGATVPCTNEQLMNYISQWKIGNISITSLMQKVAAWKAVQPC